MHKLLAASVSLTFLLAFQPSTATEAPKLVKSRKTPDLMGGGSAEQHQFQPFKPQLEETKKLKPAN